jgi:CheY-like chemotaxis protein
MDILLVEDNVGDVQLTREAMREGHLRSRLHVVADGVEALEFLRRQGPYAGSPRPDLVLLDINLPRKDGHQVLAELKTDADLCTIPVVVLTTSQSAEEVLRVYRSHANCFITKPVDLEAFFGVVRAIESFWLNVVRLPSRS